jgi:hypothetical protein
VPNNRAQAKRDEGTVWMTYITHTYPGVYVIVTERHGCEEMSDLNQNSSVLHPRLSCRICPDPTPDSLVVDEPIGSDMVGALL